MNIIKLNEKKPDIKIIKELGKELKNGKIFVYPTDTVYGIGCDPFNIISVKRIYEIKKRNIKKGLPILVNSIESAENFAIITKLAKKLMEKFWPGQLTIVLPKKNNVPEIISGGIKTIAIRQPNSLITRLLANELDSGGIIGTSANLSGLPPPISVNEAINQLGEKVDYYIDGGITDKKVPSTIIDLTENKPKLLREGSIPFEEIKRFLG